MSVVGQLSRDMVEKHLIDSDQLDKATELAAQTGKSLGEALVQLKYLTEDQIIGLISDKLEIPHIDLSSYVAETEVIALVPEDIALRYKMVPLFKVEDTLTVAMADPMNIFALDDIRIHTGLNVEATISSAESIEKAIKEYYGGSHALGRTLDNMEGDGSVASTSDKVKVDDPNAVESEGDIEAMTELPPVVKLVNQIVGEAVKSGASDIHIEPHKEQVDVRYRVDGVLRNVSEVPKSLQLPVISRVKIWSNLDIAEKRVPQDGRIKTDVGGGEVDLRVSTFPAVYGEKIVMRVLDKSSLALKLTDVGFSEENMAVFAGAIKRPSGLVLVTGPTGSGKTTTLYSALNEVVSPEKNVITLEDPVEYELDDINQGQINVKAGLTFATGLRSILRQDPDIIMVGEVRDLETASLVIRAALTGHLVFSTLHTMDAAATVTRLIDIGLEPFLISSSLAAVVAQRLARRTCPKCRADYSPPTKTLSTVGVDVGGIKFQRGKGCKHCSLTGYKGRIALLEVVSITGPVKDLVCSGASVREIRSQFREEGFKSLVEDGIKKALDGVTTLEEVLRVAQTED